MLEDIVAGLSTSPLSQIKALKNAMAVAEFTPDGVLQDANTHFLSLLGAERDILGSAHCDLVSDLFREKNQHDTFWMSLNQRNAWSGAVEYKKRDGHVLSVEVSYIPVYDEKKKLVQVLLLLQEPETISSRKQRESLQRLVFFADASEVTAVLITDKHSRIVYINQMFENMLGWAMEDLVNRPVTDLLTSAAEKSQIEAYRADLRSGCSVEREEVAVGKNRQHYWTKVISTPIHTPEDGWQYTVTMLTDITQAKLYEILQHPVLDAMARDKSLTEVLGIICSELEYVAPELTVSILAIDDQRKLRPLAAPKLPPEFSQGINGLSIGPDVGSCGTAAWRNEPVLVDDIATDPLWEKYRAQLLPFGYKGCWSTPIRNSENHVIATFAFYFKQSQHDSKRQYYQRLVTICTHLCALALEREHTRKQIEQLAFYDSLTGMPNRSMLYKKATKLIALSERCNEQVAVLFLDLDQFKKVNDSLGHAAGDELLCSVAKRLQSAVAASDVASRLSGDEFVLVLPKCDQDAATVVVARIHALLEEPIEVAGTSVSINASVGIAVYPADGRDINTLIQHADMAMYQAKNKERGGVGFFNNDMHLKAQERLVMENALRHALTHNQLQLHYQPQVYLTDHKLAGVEALARWIHPELGHVSPVKFIPLAEECGFITEIGYWVLEEACSQIAAWRKQGMSVPSISVNLSATSFHQGDLPKMIAEILARHGLQPSDLIIEITESVLLDTHPVTVQTMAEIDALGVRLSVDDFGTGYSSLSYLRRLPVSELKLDRSFVSDLESGEAAQALSQAILGIAKSLKLAIIAEGVETEGQRDWLREYGCTIAQGYLFSRPLPANAFTLWYARHH